MTEVLECDRLIVIRTHNKTIVKIKPNVLVSPYEMLKLKNRCPDKNCKNCIAVNLLWR